MKIPLHTPLNNPSPQKLNVSLQEPNEQQQQQKPQEVPITLSLTI